MATPPPARFDSCDASAGSGVREVCWHDSNAAGHSSGYYGEWIGAVCEPAVFFVIFALCFPSPRCQCCRTGYTHSSSDEREAEACAAAMVADSSTGPMRSADSWPLTYDKSASILTSRSWPA